MPSTKPPPHPTLITSKDELTKPVYRNDVFEFPSNAVGLDKLIRKEQNLAGAIRRVTNLFKMLRRFRDDYVGVEKGVPNIFAEGFGVLEQISQISTPAIAATALGSKLLITGDVIRSIPNDLGTAWGLLLEKVQLSNHDLLPYKHHAQVTAKTVKNLLPAGFDCHEQVSFLEMLCDALPTDTHASTFEVDHAKLVAAALFSNELINRKTDLKEGRSPTLFGRTAEIYLEISGDRLDYVKRMSFNPVRDHSDKSLGDLWRAIRDSLGWTQTHGKLSNHGINLVKAIESDFLMLAQSCGQPAGSIDELLPHSSIAIIDQVRRAIVKQGDDYELIVNDEVLIASSGDVVATTPTFVCRFGGETRFEEPLKPEHAAYIRRALVYSWKTEGKTVLFLADDIVRMTYEIIRKRSDVFFGTGRNDLSAAEFECLEDRYTLTTTLRDSPHFGRACDVLRCNHFTSEYIQDADDCERVLLRWLGLFDLPDAIVLLEVIAAHQQVTSANVADFLSNVAIHKDNSIVFSTKSLEDQGGVHRLFTLTQVGQEMIRSLQLNNAVAKIAAYAGGKEKLIVLAETILSGSQLLHNFKWHYLSRPNGNEVYRQEQRLFKIDECKDLFIQGMKAFSSIVIVAAAYTDSGFRTLRDYLALELKIPIERITAVGASLNDSACFWKSTEYISLNTKNAFQALINDSKRINAIFKVDDDAAYRTSLEDLNLALNQAWFFWR